MDTAIVSPRSGRTDDISVLGSVRNGRINSVAFQSVFCRATSNVGAVVVPPNPGRSDDVPVLESADARGLDPVVAFGHLATADGVISDEVLLIVTHYEFGSWKRLAGQEEVMLIYCRLTLHSRPKI